MPTLGGSVFPAMGESVGYQSLPHQRRAGGMQKDRLHVVLVCVAVIVDRTACQLPSALEAHLLFLQKAEGQQLLGVLDDE
ncbi:hypothetical protein D9M68_958640 [compost metagenome]